MSIGKIGLNIFNIYPDNLKKDSERKLSQNKEYKIQPKETINRNSRIEKNYNADKNREKIQKTDAEIEDYISNIKSKEPYLEKFYPPYPPGSEDRIKLLKSFPLFREQIVRFSFEQTNVKKISSPEEKRIQELEAEIKSMEIKKSFADSGSYSITLNQSALLNMV